MKSALRERLERLNIPGEDSLKEMVDYALERNQALATARDAMFDEKLRKFSKMAASDFEYRKAGTQARPETRTIFDHALSTNFSVQLVRNVSSFLLARVDKDAFGSRPWVAVSPRGTRNQALSAEIQKHGEYKLIEAGWRDKCRGALKDAFDLGWVPVKTAWREDWNASEHVESVLFDGEQNQPVVTDTGDYLYPEDDTQELPSEQASDMGPEGTQEDATQDTGAPRVFTKAPNIPAPHPTNKLTFKSHLIEETERLYCGLDFTPLAHRDVTYPFHAAEMTLDCPECDYIGHTISMTLEQARATYNRDGKDEEITALLERLKSGDGSPKSDATKPKEDQKEPEVKGTDIKNPTIKVLEAYFRRRVLPTGPESRIFMAIAVETREVIFTEYLTELSPRAQAPVHMLAINRVPGRAYGRGFYEMFEMAADALDRLLNGIMVRNEYHSNPANFIDDKAAEAMSTGKTVLHGPGVWNRINGAGQPIEGLFYTHEMGEMDQNSWKMVDLIMQLIQTESGVTNAAQGDMSALPAAGTATGTNSLLESSSVTHTFLLETVRSGLTPPLRYALELLYFRQDCDDAYDVLDDASAIQELTQAEGVAQAGDMGTPPPEQPAEQPTAPPAGQPGVMTYAQAQKLANVPLHVEILLSRAKSQEMKENAMAAMPQWQAFVTLPPQLQRLGLPLILQIMRGAQIDNPEKLYYTPAELEQMIAAAAQNQADSPEARVSLREQMNYADAPPSIRRQMEQEAGFKPATEEEHAAEVKGKVNDAENAAETKAPNEEREPTAA